MSIKSCILLLGVIVYLSIQVSALKCYYCDSVRDERCSNNPKQSEFEVECSPGGIRSTNDTESALVSSIRNLMSKFTDSAENDEYEVDCGTVKMTYKGLDLTGVTRGCLATVHSCEDLAKYLEGLGVTLEVCTRCTTDLCNSEIV